MSSYPPPRENLPTFNSLVFNESTDTITQGEANELYLSKQSTDVSTAPLTTFQGQIAFNNLAPISNTQPSIPSHLTTKYYVDFYFLTQSLAASTYLTILNAASTYLSITNAASTYQAITGMTAYLTTASASAIYQPISLMTDYVSRTGAVAEDISGIKTFTTSIKTNNYDANSISTALHIGQNVTSGEIRIGRTSKTATGEISIGTTASSFAVYSTAIFRNLTGIDDGKIFQARIIRSSNQASNGHTLFDDMGSGGVLTIGNALSSNVINGATTFNQAASVTGLLTASGNINVNTINSNLTTATNYLYNNLGISSSIAFGTISRTLSIYGAVNMVNTCQFSNALQTNDITHIGSQSNTAKSIYTGLTTGGSVTIGANTANTTTNIRGGAISIGNSAYNLTIESPTTFNNTLKTDDITAISNTATQSIYTGLASSGVINMGSNTAGTITNIYGGAINIGGSANNLTINSPTTFSNDIQTQDITCNNYLFFTDTDLNVNQNVIYHFGGLLIFNTPTNYSNGYEFMCNGNTTILINEADTEINNSLNVKGGLKYRYDKIVDEIQTLTTASEVLQFPLKQTTIFTNTGNISVTLPEITTDTQIGLRFTFLNLGSVSTITTFNAQSANKIITIGQVSQVTSSTALINNANNSCSLVIVKLSGVYCWAEYI